jgi:CHAT domain-containing protein
VKSYDIIAIASHAVTESVTYKTPRPAIVFTPGPGRSTSNDGLLHPDEIEGLNIKADTVILSACETASGNGQPGAEALSGLAQAFLYAGSRTILATQWKVESLSAASLMSQTAVTLSSTPDVAERLRRSMRTLKVRKGYAHPAYWAPFVVVERTIS